MINNSILKKTRSKYSIFVYAGLLLTNLFFLYNTALATPAQELITLLKKTRTMQANFTQKIYDEKGKLMDQNKGYLVLVKPNQFHWQVNEPMNQLVISNGQRVWIYNPDLEQVIIKPIDKTINATPLAILSGSSTVLAQNFVITKQKCSYHLTAKDQEFNFKIIILRFNNDILSTMTLFDNLGQKTELYFSQVKLNRTIKFSYFQFRLPKGVDVVQ